MKPELLKPNLSTRIFQAPILVLHDLLTLLSFFFCLLQGHLRIPLPAYGFVLGVGGGWREYVVSGWFHFHSLMFEIFLYIFPHEIHPLKHDEHELIQAFLSFHYCLSSFRKKFWDNCP